MIGNKKIEFIPLDIGKNFYNLLVMDASGNGIKSLTKKELTRLYRLKNLNLENNEIKVVKFNAFDDLISLEILDLDFNQIKFLDGKLLSSNLYLKIFSARQNELETLQEDIFEHCIMLDTVKLEGNKILRLSHKLLDHVPHLNKILLEKNVCIDKNYDGGKIVSTFAVDMAKNCGDEIKDSSTKIFQTTLRIDIKNETSLQAAREIKVENSYHKFLYCTIALTILIILTIIGAVSYKIYKSKQWQVRLTTIEAFENPHYSKNPENHQGKVTQSHQGEGVTTLGQRYEVEGQKSQFQGQDRNVQVQDLKTQDHPADPYQFQGRFEIQNIQNQGQNEIKSQNQLQNATENQNKIKKIPSQHQKPNSTFDSSYHEFHNVELNEEARYVNFESLKNAKNENSLADHLYEEVKDDKGNSENCFENPSYST